MSRPRKWENEQERREAQNARRKAERRNGTAKPIKSENVFIGVDGEGAGQWKTHTYVLLGIGNVQIHSVGGGGLMFTKVAAALWEEFLAHPTSVFAGFFLGYDFCQWFRTLPEERARRLFHPEMRERRPRREIDRETGEVKEIPDHRGPWPVNYQGWEFDILGMKRFRLRKEGAKEWMYINDAGSFFQAPFLKVIDPHEWREPVVTEEEYAQIKTGKDQRDTAVLDDDMRKYNILENIVLSRVLVRLDQGFRKAGIRLARDEWFGPGQAAQKWLDKVRAPTGEMVSRKVPRDGPLGDILHKGRMTYYGGWFEIFAHGQIPGNVYEYDINSAYPFIISTLPCLLHGKWYRDDSPVGRDTRRDQFRIVHARIDGSDPVCGSVLHRRKDHSIVRPWKTAGWYWESELAAGMRAGVIDEVEVRGGVRYEPCDCKPPLRGLAGLYDERLRVGKDTPEGKAYKLMYNSAYGKFAQSIGNPKYGNSIYASLITSGCRTMILNAIGTHPEGTNALLMVATDGVYFRSRHGLLDLGGGLGQWSEAEKRNLTLFKPGVYWDDDTRERITSGKDAKFKSRGISARAFAGHLAAIDAAFRGWPEGEGDGSDGGTVQQTVWPRVTFTSGFSMVTCLQALQRGRWELAGTLGHEPNELCAGCAGTHMVQDSDPVQKRRGIYRSGDIWRSSPWETGGSGEIESIPYDRAFGQPDPEEYGVTDDGTVLDSWRLN